VYYYKDMHISQTDLQILKDKLLSEEKTTAETLASFASKNKNASGEYTSNFPAFGDANDEDAQTSAVEEYGTRLSTEQALEERLRAIRNALARLEENTYGHCLNCKKEILLARLNVSPEAELCGKCK